MVCFDRAGHKRDNFRVKMALCLKGLCHEKSMETETVEGKARYQERVGFEFYIFMMSLLICYEYLKDCAHRSKSEFMLGHSSGVKFVSDNDNPRPPHHQADFVLRLQRLPQ